MESSRRDLFIDMVIYRFIFKSNPITVYPNFTFIPKIKAIEGPIGKQNRLFLSQSGQVATCKFVVRAR